MTPKQLPGRANLEQLKKQAKNLLHSAQSREPEALRRFCILLQPAFDSTKPPAAVEFALHDAQSVIAREYGFKSWRALREHIEEQLLSAEAAVGEFVRCATGDAKNRATRLLSRFPAIAHDGIHAELVLGDAFAVGERLRCDPELAAKPGGVHGWEPLQYVCHTCMLEDLPGCAEGLVKIARGLLALGANPNAEYHWNWHRELPRTVLWAALCVVKQPALAEVLLQAGANPTDGVSTHICAGSGNLAALELLHRFGVDVDGIPGGVPPLPYILGWANNRDGIRWLLERGADPNLFWNGPGDAPLHVAAQRWDVAMVELLVRHGADVELRRRDGRTPHTVAALHGNKEVAGWLRARGAANELSELENFVADCAGGDLSAATQRLRANPGLRGELILEHHLMMHAPAERGQGAVLETMLRCGFDPNAKDGDGVTALHRAAMSGRVEAARVLIAGGASVEVLDGMFAASPLVWATEGWKHGSHAGADHIGVARELIAAGSPLGWQPPEKAPDTEGTLECLAELVRAADGGAPPIGGSPGADAE
jgi:ankyrin repeat protein